MMAENAPLWDHAEKSLIHLNKLFPSRDQREQGRGNPSEVIQLLQAIENLHSIVKLLIREDGPEITKLMEDFRLSPANFSSIPQQTQSPGERPHIPPLQTHRASPSLYNSFQTGQSPRKRSRIDPPHLQASLLLAGIKDSNAAGSLTDRPVEKERQMPVENVPMTERSVVRLPPIREILSQDSKGSDLTPEIRITHSNSSPGFIRAPNFQNLDQTFPQPTYQSPPSSSFPSNQKGNVYSGGALFHRQLTPSPRLAKSNMSFSPFSESPSPVSGSLKRTSPDTTLTSIAFTERSHLDDVDPEKKLFGHFSVSHSTGVMVDQKVPVLEKERKPHRRRKNADIDLKCLECGTKETPEWRRGPNGPKTLCNACGLKYAKSLKIKQAEKEKEKQAEEQKRKQQKLEKLEKNEEGAKMEVD